VLPEFRGKGVGLALINYITRQSRKDGAEETWLYNDHDGPASGLCRTSGYHTVAEDARQIWRAPLG
jgi:GNAT superfamily N-acetyltransferase